MPLSSLIAFFQETPAPESGTQNMIRIAAGVLAVVLVVIIVMRRKSGAKKAKEDDEF
jgi:hypothetical protein